MESWTTPQNILSVVLIFVTLAYTVTSFFTWLESRAVRKQKSQPNVIVYLRSNTSHDTLYVCVKNIGEGCAYNVRIIPTQDYFIFGKDKRLGDFSLFSDGVEIFPPQFEMNMPLDFWNSISLKENPMVSFDIYFLDMKGKEFKRNISLPFKHMAVIYSEPPAMSEERIPYYLCQIQNDLKEMSRKL